MATRPDKIQRDPRPDNVPASARWDDEEGFWVDGPLDDDGRPHGLTTSYWPDGFLCCTVPREHGAVHGQVTRYHLSGEVAQTFTMIHDVFHGPRIWYFTDGPTYELGRPEKMSRLVKRSEHHYDHGIVLEIRHYNVRGRRVDHRGEPMGARPEGLPEQAWKDPRDKRWKVGGAVGEGPHGIAVGPWREWDAAGRLLRELEYGQDGSTLEQRDYHEDGSLAWDMDLQAGTGCFLPGPGSEHVASIYVPEGAVETRFTPHELKDGHYWALEPRFFDGDGNEVASGSDDNAGQVPSGCGSVSTGGRRPVCYWTRSLVEGEETRTSYWARDGFLSLRTVHVDGALRTVQTRPRDGAVITEWFVARPDGVGQRVHERTMIEHAGRTLTYDYIEQRCVSAEIRAKGMATRRLDLTTLQRLDLHAYQHFFNTFFVPVFSVRGTTILVDGWSGVHTSGVDPSRTETPFRASSLTRDVDGDWTVVVLEGSHSGEIFAVDRERCWYDLEDLEDAYEDQGIDVEGLSVDECVEKAFFFGEPLATSFEEFLQKLVVQSGTTRWRRLEDLKPLG